MQNIKRGEIYYADLSPTKTSGYTEVRPVLVIQNDVGNQYAPTTIIVPITSQADRQPLPTRVQFTGVFQGKSMDVLAILDQPRTLDKSRLRECIGTVDERAMAQIDSALVVCFGLEHS